MAPGEGCSNRVLPRARWVLPGICLGLGLGGQDLGAKLGDLREVKFTGPKACRVDLGAQGAVGAKGPCVPTPTAPLQVKAVLALNSVSAVLLGVGLVVFFLSFTFLHGVHHCTWDPEQMECVPAPLEVQVSRSHDCQE